jgi:heterodisulfide reductase subunit A
MAVTEGNDGTETGCVHFVRGRVVEVTGWPIHPSEEGKLIIRAEDTLAGFVRRIPVGE